MRFPDTFLDEIRARIRVSEVIGRRVSWDRRKSVPARGDYWACCPFHNEKTPSFHADDRKGRYYCFGCRASGDIFTFLVEKDGLSFPESVQRLASDAGVPMPVASPEESRRAHKRAGLADVVEMATRYYEAALRGDAARAARAYLADRGFGTELQRRFRIGYAPADRYGLKTRLSEQGVTVDQMTEAGLLVHGEDIDEPFDRFRERIMFPIRDARGRVIAFGGRALSRHARAKYLNSPETALFHKGRILYNLDQARGPAHESGTILVVEGYTDVIALAGAGLANAVAPLGTALTADQLALLWRIAPEPVLCFDGDEAGIRAAFRAVDLALPELKPGHSIRFAFLPQGRDPDDLVREGGREAMLAVIDSAEPLSAVLWRRETERADFSVPERRAAFEARLDEALARIADPRVRQHYRNDFFERKRSLWVPSRPSGDARRYRGEGGRAGPYVRGRRSSAWVRSGSHFRTGASPKLKALANVDLQSQAAIRRERLMMITLINHPFLIEDHLERIAELDMTSADLDRLRRQILDVASLHQPLDTTAMRDHLRQQGLADEVERLEAGLTHRSDWFAFSEAAPPDVMVAWLQMVALHRKSVTLRRELEMAERAFAIDPSDDTLAHLNEVREQMRSSLGEEASFEGYGSASGRADMVDR